MIVQNKYINSRNVKELLYIICVALSSDYLSIIYWYLLAEISVLDKFAQILIKMCERKICS